MKLLRLANTLNSTSAPYNQFSLGLKKVVDQTFCSLFDHDVVIDRDIKAFHGKGSLVTMLKLVRALVRKHDYDVVHIHSGLTGILFIIAIFPFRLSLLKKTVFTLHNSWNVLTPRNRLLNFIAMFASKKVCICSQSSLNSIPRLISYLFKNKIQAVVNGFDNYRMDKVEKEITSTTHFDKKSKIKMVYIGAMNNTKNQIALLEVLKEMRMEGELIFLGDGQNKNFLSSFSEKVPGPIKIKFSGRVSRNTAIKHMFEADIFISLSKGEGLPIAVLEAMYAGCFLILSKIPPHKEISPPLKRCLFVKTANTNEIVQALEYVEDNIEMLKGNRIVSKEYAINKFSLNSMLVNYLKIYNSFLALKV